MNKKTIILIITGFILTIFITIGVTLAITKGKQEKTTNKVNATEQKKENKENIEKDKKEENNIPITNETKNESIVENKTANQKEESINKITTNESNNNTLNNSNEIKNEEENNSIVTEKNEVDVVNYIENVEKNSTGEDLKKGFVNIIDFIFYDGEIYGKTFKELSNSAKIKIITLALKIDSKIDEYFPDYKEKISNTTNKVYTNIKTKLVTLYLDTTVKICNNNPTVCEDAKQGLKELKTNFGITWEFVKDISGIGITKLKDWYEIWREE